MNKIIPTNWQTQIKIFEKYGCVFQKQKGSHLILRYLNAKRAVVIPKHSEVSVTIILNNMKTVGMTREQYFKFLNE
jgi:predicted RNA binding protein YcfA (HicA-like mRNA interferase family)